VLPSKSADIWQEILYGKAKKWEATQRLANHEMALIVVASADNVCSVPKRLHDGGRKLLN
jgi:hypothetical protein